MNPIAIELNNQLEGTAAGRLLSDFGKRIYFPRGIVAQAAEASARAKRFDATIGMAVEHKDPMVLPCIREQVPGLSNRELTAYAPTGGTQTIREGWKAQILTKNPDLKATQCSLPMESSLSSRTTAAGAITRSPSSIWLESSSPQ